MKDRHIYKIIFHNRGDVYELFARKVGQASMYAFVEVEEIVFGERSSVLVDPSEERLKTEFAGVRRTYIPLQAVVRIDEVEKEGPGKIISGGEGKGSVTPFPAPMPPTGRNP
jgi:hypothetical protein